MLADEELNRYLVVTEFPRHFRCGAELLVLAQEVFSRLCKHNPKTPPHVRAILIGLLARQIRQCRSVLLLCEHTFDENAGILCRSMLEGMLAVKFIINGTAPQHALSPATQKRLDELPSFPAGTDAVEFRTTLYAEHRTFSLDHTLDRLLKVPSYASVIPLQRQQASRENAAEARESIGADWSKVLDNRPWTYSGLSVAQLSEVLELNEYYLKVYGLASGPVHAMNAMDYVELVDGEFQIFLGGQSRGDLLQVTQSLGLLGAMLDDLDEFYSLGMKDKLSALNQKVYGQLCDTGEAGSQ
jgi:hypothetical protein